MAFHVILMSALVAATLGVPVTPPLARRGNLPTPVSVPTSKSYLAEIVVENESNSPPYDRDLFHAWITISGNCNTREYVLKRDGTNVTTDNACKATSGSWFSDYDGVTWTDPDKVDIDHLVPLKEAWVSGARYWSHDQREAFANDVTRPQLLAVTDYVNQAKGDQDLAEWLPMLESYQCEYVRAWIQVKHYYGLSMDDAEKVAAGHVLDNVC